jgi:hypothetical protein
MPSKPPAFQLRPITIADADAIFDTYARDH